MPAIIYKNAKGERVPSFSTIKSQWGIAQNQLIHWAYNQGVAGVDLYEQKEANVGTCAHEMVDCDAKGKDFDATKYPADILEQAQVCYDNWIRWKQMVAFQAIESEISLVSEKYQYGGTIDSVALINDEVCLLDLKTGKDVYPDAIVQLMAYRHLWNENFPDIPLVGGFHVIRTGKEMAMFQHNWYDNFPQAWEAFEHLRRLYDLHKEIKKLK
jgi:hypothetical protein